MSTIEFCHNAGIDGIPIPIHDLSRFPLLFPWLAQFCPIHMGFPLDSNVQWKSHSSGHLYSAFRRRLVSKSAKTSYRLPKKPPERRSAPFQFSSVSPLWQMILHYGNWYILLPSWWWVSFTTATVKIMLTPNSGDVWARYKNDRTV